MNNETLFFMLEKLVAKKGLLRVGHDESGGGLGYYWCATINGEWPYCSASTLKGSLKILVSEHLRLDKELLQKQINAIDESCNL